MSRGGRGTHRGIYEATRPDKTGSPRANFKSSWELAFMKMCDQHPAIIHWVYEPLRIPYVHPISHKNTVYVPDFIIVYLDKKHKKHTQLVEIKPAKQSHTELALSKYDKVELAVNAAKWDAARRFAKMKGMTFRILTEHDIFN